MQPARVQQAGVGHAACDRQHRREPRPTRDADHVASRFGTQERHPVRAVEHHAAARLHALEQRRRTGAAFDPAHLEMPVAVVVRQVRHRIRTCPGNPGQVQHCELSRTKNRGCIGAEAEFADVVRDVVRRDQGGDLLARRLRGAACIVEPDLDAAVARRAALAGEVPALRAIARRQPGRVVPQHVDAAVEQFELAAAARARGAFVRHAQAGPQAGAEQGVVAIARKTVRRSVEKDLVHVVVLRQSARRMPIASSSTTTAYVFRSTMQGAPTALPVRMSKAP